jgi:hypothetical protein
MWRVFYDGQWWFSFDELHYFRAPSDAVPNLRSLERLLILWDTKAATESEWASDKLTITTMLYKVEKDEVECFVTRAKRVAPSFCNCWECHQKK